jgi:gliding motility-associated-like protein
LRNLYFFLVYIFFCHFLCAQVNLVPNPGFDSVDCFSFRIYDWENSNFTPANECFPFPGSPANDLQLPMVNPNAFSWSESYITPRSGGGVAGIATYGSDDSRTWAVAKLKRSLKKNTFYYLSFFVKPHYPRFSWTKWFYVKDIGMGLIYQKKDLNWFPDYFDDPPAIENTRDFLKDTGVWKRISGKYFARGFEQYAVIGNFKRDFQSTFINDGARLAPPYIVPSGFLYLDDVVVSEFNPLPDSAILCKNGNILFDSKFYYSNYLWSTKDTTSALNVTKPGIYTVEAFIDGLTFADTVNVIPEKDYKALPAETTLCRFGTPVKLTVTVDAQYLWSTGETTPTIAASKAGIYAVTITTPQCKLYSECNVVTLGCFCQYYAPNIFTPNNDGINDNFRPEFKCKVVKPKEYRFSIFNRYGQEVFRTENPNEAWDGTWNGQKLNPDVYVWIVDFDTYIDDKFEYRKVQESGDISLTY